MLIYCFGFTWKYKTQVKIAQSVPHYPDAPYCLNMLSSRAHDVGGDAVGGGCVRAGLQSAGRWRLLEARRGSPAGAEAGDRFSTLLLGHRM